MQNGRLEHNLLESMPSKLAGKRKVINGPYGLIDWNKLLLVKNFDFRWGGGGPPRFAPLKLRCWSLVQPHFDAGQKDRRSLRLTNHGFHPNRGVQASNSQL